MWNEDIVGSRKYASKKMGLANYLITLIRRQYIESQAHKYVGSTEPSYETLNFTNFVFVDGQNLNCATTSTFTTGRQLFHDHKK